MVTMARRVKMQAEIITRILHGFGNIHHSSLKQTDGITGSRSDLGKAHHHGSRVTVSQEQG